VGKCGGPDTCGGLFGFTCGEGYYCDFAPEAMCGADDALGTCALKPALCITIEAPVCGCDGKDYSNACLANSAGVSVASEGSCDATGNPCGGLFGFKCPEGYLCDYKLADACGVNDAVGSCLAIPEACLPFENEVCGCDGKTYTNSCIANAAGVSVQYTGVCK
jgi:hypothetical protein